MAMKHRVVLQGSRKDGWLWVEQVLVTASLITGKKHWVDHYYYECYATKIEAMKHKPQQNIRSK